MTQNIPLFFVDLSGFLIALSAYTKVKPSPDDPHTKAAIVFLRRFNDEIKQGIREVLLPMTTESYLSRFKTRASTVARSMSGLEFAMEQADVIKDVFAVLRVHPEKIKETFIDAKAVAAATRIALASSSDDAIQELNLLSTVPSATSVRVLRSWIRKAAEIVGASPSKIETVLADASEVSALGQELKTVESIIDKTDPSSPLSAELQETRSEILTQIQAVVADSDSPSVIMAAAAQSAAGPREYSTKIGQELRLNPDKESAMMMRGKGIIAAGAGSGKTMTLAAKVVHHIRELGVPASSIIATSFSRKSAAELLKRINKYGGDIPDRVTGFATTHRVALNLILEYGGGGRTSMQRYEQTDLFSLAMMQVKMGPFGIPTPAPLNIFASELARPSYAPPTPAAPSVQQPAIPTTGVTPSLTFNAALNAAFNSRSRLDNYQRAFIESFFDPKEKGYYAKRTVTNNFTNHVGLSSGQKNVLQQIFTRTGVNFNLQSSGRMAAVKKDQSLRDKYVSAKHPANEWFNIGATLEDDAGKPLPIGAFRHFVTKAKGRLVSPTEAWHMAKGDPEEQAKAAVYAAYEYLKSPKGEPSMAGKSDADDIILDASRMMLANPNILRSIQNRFKVVLVDEAQDLNRSQHVLFGLISGFVDPKKVALVADAKTMGDLAKADGTMTADTYTLIGDDKQCVEENSPVNTPDGTVLARDIKVGDTVLSYRNGQLTPQTVSYALPTDWSWGIKVTTESGHTLTMSPNHRLWATDPRLAQGELAVCLVHHTSVGFSIGVADLNSYEGQSFLRDAGRMWILDICPDQESARIAETRYRLRYGVPCVSAGKGYSESNQALANAMLEEFNMNGIKILGAKHYGFNYPHRTPQFYGKHHRNGLEVTLLAHTPHGTLVSMDWEGPQYDTVTAGMGVTYHTKERRSIRRYFDVYREALAFAEKLSEYTGTVLSQSISAEGCQIREIPAAGLFVGMSVPVLFGNGMILDTITSIEQVKGSFIDLDIDDASNFFAGDILTHNSIYEFRGADPEAFIDMSDLVEGGVGFKTEVLKTNYRSGALIVQAANRLISHNKKQIPMTCDANPKRVDQGGVTTIPFPPQEKTDMIAPAVWLAEQIESMVELGQAGSKGYDSFGVGIRSNAEAYTYGLELLKKGIPFRSKANFFRDRNTKALLAWLTIVDEGESGSEDRVNAAINEARSAPTSMLGDAFMKKLTEKATGNYLTWLRRNYRSLYGAGAKYTNTIKVFVDNLEYALTLKGGSGESVLASLLKMQGIDGSTVAQSLIDAVREDAEIMAEIRAESLDGVVTEEAVENHAFAPIQPLLGLISSRADLTESMKFARTLQSANDRMTSDDDPEARGFTNPAVTLGTIHSWKGLEVSTMFVPFVGGKFPRPDGTEEDLASERRLAYVAITRAENQLFIMDIPTVRATKTGVIVERSQFVSEVCSPTQSPNNTMKLGSLEFLPVPKGWSPTDEAVMEAYLRGEDPFAVVGLPSAWGETLYDKEGGR